MGLSDGVAIPSQSDSGSSGPNCYGALPKEQQQACQEYGASTIDDDVAEYIPKKLQATVDTDNETVTFNNYTVPYQSLDHCCIDPYALVRYVHEEYLYYSRHMDDDLAVMTAIVAACANNAAVLQCPRSWVASVEGDADILDAQLNFGEARAEAVAAVVAYGGLFGSDMSPVDFGSIRVKTRSRHCSFTGETEVLMADGNTKPISEVELGDEVLATDPETGEQTTQIVTGLWYHNDTVVDLNLDNGASITTTEVISTRVR